MKQYAFENVAPMINSFPLSGFAPGDDAISGDRREDAFSDEVGADGEMLVTKTSNKSGLFIFKLQQSSSSNSYLNGLFVLQETGIFAPVIVSVVDTVTGDSLVGVQGYIKRPAPMTRGAGANTQTWEIVVEDYNAIFGLFNLVS